MAERGAPVRGPVYAERHRARRAPVAQEPPPPPGLGIGATGGWDGSPPQPYGLASATSVMVARSASSKLRYALGLGGRMPWRARNSAGLISATVTVDTRAGGNISPVNGSVSERFDFGIGHLSHSAGCGPKLFVWAALWLIGMDDGWG